MEEFTKWLEDELKKREWLPSDLGRVAKLGNSTLTRVLNGTRRPGPEVCTAIAKALGEPPEKVFRLAGLLPPLPKNEDVTLQQLVELARQLPYEERLEAIRYLDYRYKSYKERFGRVDNDKPQSASIET